MKASRLMPSSVLALAALIVLFSTGCEQRTTAPTKNPAKPSALTAMKTCGVQGSARTKVLARSVDKETLFKSLSDGKYSLKSVVTSARPDRSQVTSATLIYTLPDFGSEPQQAQLEEALKSAVAGVSCQRLEDQRQTAVSAKLEAPMIVELPAKMITWLWTIEYQIEKSKEIPDVLGNVVASTASIDDWTTEAAKSAKLQYSLISDSEFEIVLVKEIATEGKPTEQIQARYRFVKSK